MTASGQPPTNPATPPSPADGGTRELLPSASAALRLLAAVQAQQQDLPGPAALAWERAGFRAAFLGPGPGQRIRAFLSGVRPED